MVSSKNHVVKILDILDPLPGPPPFVATVTKFLKNLQPPSTVHVVYV